MDVVGFAFGSTLGLAALGLVVYGLFLTNKKPLKIAGFRTNIFTVAGLALLVLGSMGYLGTAPGGQVDIGDVAQISDIDTPVTSDVTYYATIDLSGSVYQKDEPGTAVDTGSTDMWFFKEWSNNPVGKDAFTIITETPDYQTGTDANGDYSITVEGYANDPHTPATYTIAFVGVSGYYNEIFRNIQIAKTDDKLDNDLSLPDFQLRGVGTYSLSTLESSNSKAVDASTSYTSSFVISLDDLDDYSLYTIAKFTPTNCTITDVKYGGTSMSIYYDSSNTPYVLLEDVIPEGTVHDQPVVLDVTYTMSAASGSIVMSVDDLANVGGATGGNTLQNGQVPHCTAASVTLTLT